MLCRAFQSSLVVVTASTVLIVLVALGGISRRLLVAAETAAQQSCEHRLPQRDGHPRVKTLVPNPTAFNRKVAPPRSSIHDVPPTPATFDDGSGSRQWISTAHAVRLVGAAQRLSLQACAIRLQI